MRWPINPIMFSFAVTPEIGPNWDQRCILPDTWVDVTGRRENPFK